MANRKCGLPCDTPETGVHNLSAEEVKILQYRFDFPVKSLCHEHFKDQFSRFGGWNLKCSDPCSRHKQACKSRLREIGLELARNVKNFTEHRIVPGKKVCRSCQDYLLELIRSNTVADSASAREDAEDEAGDDQGAAHEDNPEFDSPQFDSPG